MTSPAPWAFAMRDALYTWYSDVATELKRCNSIGNIKGVPDVFVGGGRFVLDNDAVLGDTPFDQISLHALTLRYDLVITLAAGNNDRDIRVFDKQIVSLIEPFLEHRGRFLAPELAAQDHDHIGLFGTVEAGPDHIKRQVAGKAEPEDIEGSDHSRHYLSCLAVPEILRLVPEERDQKDRSGDCSSRDIAGN